MDNSFEKKKRKCWHPVWFHSCQGWCLAGGELFSSGFFLANLTVFSGQSHLLWLEDLLRNGDSIHFSIFSNFRISFSSASSSYSSRISTSGLRFWLQNAAILELKGLTNELLISQRVAPPFVSTCFYLIPKKCFVSTYPKFSNENENIHLNA